MERAYIYTEHWVLFSSGAGASEAFFMHREDAAAAANAAANGASIGHERHSGSHNGGIELAEQLLSPDCDAR